MEELLGGALRPFSQVIHPGSFRGHATLVNEGSLRCPRAGSRYPRSEGETMLNPHIFSAYGVRGRVGEDINADVVRPVGRPYATLLRRRGSRRVAVGQDNRLSSDELKAGFVEGVRAA